MRRLLDGPRCLPLNESGHEGEFFRGQVRITQHHFVRLPSAQFHQLGQRSAALHVPRGPGVPHVVEAEVLDAGALLRQAPGSGALMDALTCEGEAPARVLSPLRLERCHGIHVQGNAAAVARLRPTSIRPVPR
jgi:hypothetical protein